MQIESLDHLVIAAADPDATVRSYPQLLGMTGHTFGSGRIALLARHIRTLNRSSTPVRCRQVSDRQYCRAAATTRSGTNS